MMKLKMLLAFVLVAGLGCVAELSARTVQKRVGKPTTTYKERLERIQRSNGFKARSGVRGGKFERSEGMDPKELQLMLLQGRKLNEDQQAQLDQFHADNPEIEQQFNEAMIAEGFEVPEEEEATEEERVKSQVDAVLEEANTSPEAQQVKSELASDVSTASESEDAVIQAADKTLEDAEAVLSQLKDSRSNMGWLSVLARRKIDEEIAKQQEVVDSLKKANQAVVSAEGNASEEEKQGLIASVKTALYQTIATHKFLVGIATVVTVAGAGYVARETEVMQAALSKANGIWNYVTDNKVCNMISSAASSAKDTVCGVSSKFVTAFNKDTGRTAREMQELKSAAVIGRALSSYKDVLQESPEKAEAVSEAILSLAMQSGEYLSHVG